MTAPGGETGRAGARERGAAAAILPDRAALARDLLERAHEAMFDVALLATSGGSLRGIAARAADAAVLGARSLLAPHGLDHADPAATVLLFDRELVATDLVSRPCGEVVHRAFRALRESEEADVAVFYAARVKALRDGAVALLAEADIVLDRTLGDAPSREEPPPPESAAYDAEPPA